MAERTSSPPGDVLALNAGSSTVKYAVFDAAGQRTAAGKVERLGPAGSRQTVDDLLDQLAGQGHLTGIAAVGHRLVHGGPDHVEPEVIGPAVLADLHRVAPIDPTHLPGELALIEEVARRRPDLPQVACYDTAFHADLPAVARRLPIPRRYIAAGVRRYGFHGLSFAYLTEELARLDPAGARGRVILAHLGSGSSLAAARGGACVDTTMGFTPTGGLVMGTRTGDLDPGVLVHLMRTEGLSADQLDDLVNRRSGLLGVSETSADVRDLLARASSDPRAAEAVELFCYTARKWVGALAAALGGVDALVFAGGVGENAAPIRSSICDGLGFLGVRLDPARNASNEAIISADGSACRVRVIRTDEEQMIARSVRRVLNLPAESANA